MKASEWAFDRIKEAFDLAARGRKDEHFARDHAQKHGLFAANHFARRRTRRSHNVVLVPALQQFPFGRPRLVGLWGENIQIGGAQCCGEQYDWKQPNRLWVVQTGESVDQANVFKAHAVPQGLCANLINALNLLANQQEDGDGFLQNIVKDLGGKQKRSHGLRGFI